MSFLRYNCARPVTVTKEGTGIFRTDQQAAEFLPPISQVNAPVGSASRPRINPPLRSLGDCPCKVHAPGTRLRRELHPRPGLPVTTGPGGLNRNPPRQIPVLHLLIVPLIRLRQGVKIVITSATAQPYDPVTRMTAFYEYTKLSGRFTLIERKDNKKVMYYFLREKTPPIRKTNAIAPIARDKGRGDFAVVGTGATKEVISAGGRRVGSRACA